MYIYTFKHKTYLNHFTIQLLSDYSLDLTMYYNVHDNTFSMIHFLFKLEYVKI